MAAWVTWLLIVAGVCTAADIGWTARIASWIALACTFSSCRQFLGLGGDRAVKAAGHDDLGPFIVLVTAPAHRLRVSAVELRRFGNRLWVFRFSTARGAFFRVIRPVSQEPRALRQFLRRLNQKPSQGAAGQFGPRRGSS